MLPLLDDATIELLTIPRRVKSEEWIAENIRLPDGRPFSFRDYPWARYVCRSYDDPQVREIAIQGAAQIGKSELCRALFLCGMATQPGNGIFGTSTIDLAKRTTKTKIFPTLAKSDAFADQIGPENTWNMEGPILLATHAIYLAWSGSATTLGDVTCRHGHAGEIDKWDASETDEADSLDLFSQRFAAVIDPKILYESTPTIEGRSRVLRKVRSGSNSRFYVPCPRCGWFQTLQLGDGTGGGIRFEKPKSGPWDVGLAGKTARYHCEKCDGVMENRERMESVRRCVAVPQGATLDRHTGAVFGSGDRPYPVASFQISRLYAPHYTWGQLARDFVESLQSPTGRRNLDNSILGEAHSLKTHQPQAVGDVAGRMVDADETLGVVPDGTAFLTCGVDRQIDHMPWMVCAWGPGKRGWAVAYGIARDWPSLRQDVLDRVWRNREGSLDFEIGLTLIDCRYNTTEFEVQEFCQSVNRERRRVWPSMGVRGSGTAGRPFVERAPDATWRTKRTGAGPFYVVSVNTDYWQGWAHAMLEGIATSHLGRFTFPNEAAEDEDLWRQLVNERENEKGVWGKIHESTPVDFRDIWRYARCAAECWTMGDWNRTMARIPLNSLVDNPTPRVLGENIAAPNQTSLFREEEGRRRVPKRANGGAYDRWIRQ